MPRPYKCKVVTQEPESTYFKPRGIPLNKLEEVNITVEELESLKLVNLDNLSQIDAAERMNIHQSTFQRTLTRAREKLTDALVQGKAIHIRGGSYVVGGETMPGGDGTGPEGKGPRTGRGEGRCAGKEVSAIRRRRGKQ